MQKGLIAIFMIALMLVTGLSSMVTANAISVSKEISDDNNVSGDLGFILHFVYILDILGKRTYIARWVTFELTDLWTGEVIREFRFFGVILFIFLPLGHDYELKISTSEGSETEIIEDLGFFYKSSTTIEMWG